MKKWMIILLFLVELNSLIVVQSQILESLIPRATQSFFTHSAHRFGPSLIGQYQSGRLLSSKRRPTSTFGYRMRQQHQQGSGFGTAQNENLLDNIIHKFKKIFRALSGKTGSHPDQVYNYNYRPHVPSTSTGCKDLSNCGAGIVGPTIPNRPVSTGSLSQTGNPIYISKPQNPRPTSKPKYNCRGILGQNNVLHYLNCG